MGGSVLNKGEGGLGVSFFVEKQVTFGKMVVVFLRRKGSFMA